MDDLNENWDGEINAQGNDLQRLIESNDSNLSELSIGQRGFLPRDDHWHRIGVAIGSNLTICLLDLSSNRDRTIEGWPALFGVLQSQDCMLEYLDLSETGIDDSIATAFATALSTNRSLKSLNLSSNSQYTFAGWQIDLLFNALVSPINFTFVSKSSLSALDRLHLRSNNISEETLISLANSLTTNNKLEELLLDADNITSNGWAVLTQVLCNKSSILDTFNSNHTLEKLTINNDSLPEDLRELLRINSENNKREAARLKVIQAHFSGGSDLRPIIDMKLNILPHAIAWMGRGGTIDDITDLLYNFVRSAPYSFEVNKPRSMDATHRSVRSSAIHHSVGPSTKRPDPPGTYAGYFSLMRP